jgi:GrpB-like predicted nucleotidyltransferase (UPF0157 family)
MTNELVVAPYDPRWADMFEEERVRLEAALLGLALRIDHHGSTSVPGLPAKPIIDIQVSVARLHPMDGYRVVLRELGYRHVPHPDDAFCPFFHRPDGTPHSHHIHVVESGGTEERRTLAFRDYLRENAGIADEYARLKMTLAPRFTHATMADYASAKGEFIERVIAQALAAGYPRELR